MPIPGLQGVSPRDVTTEAVRGFVDDDMTTYAAALAFRALLALFPFAIFLLTLLGALGLTGFFDWLVEQAQTALPQNAAGLMEEIIGEIRDGGRGGLLSLGFVAALWPAAAAVRSLMRALNAAFDVAESRAAWKRFLLSIVATIGLAVVLIAATALMLVGRQAMEWLSGYFGFGGLIVDLWSLLRWPLATILLLLLVAVVYAITPNIDQPFRFATVGSVIAVIAWIIASLGFSFYVANFGSYGNTYGSLGGVIVLLLYFFLSAGALLLGAEVNAAIHHGSEGAAVTHRHA